MVPLSVGRYVFSFYRDMEFLLGHEMEAQQYHWRPQVKSLEQVIERSLP
jgi:hypothetical protein